MDQPDIKVDEVIPRTFWHTAVLLCGIIGPVLFVIVYFTFGDIAPDYDMLRQPIGGLELIDYGWIQSLNFIVFGLSIAAFGIGLRIELRSGFGVNALPLFHLF